MTRVPASVSFGTLRLEVFVLRRGLLFFKIISVEILGGTNEAVISKGTTALLSPSLGLMPFSLQARDFDIGGLDIAGL